MSWLNGKILSNVEVEEIIQSTFAKSGISEQYPTKFNFSDLACLWLPDEDPDPLKWNCILGVVVGINFRARGILTYDLAVPLSSNSKTPHLWTVLNNLRGYLTKDEFTPPEPDGGLVEKGVLERNIHKDLVASRSHLSIVTKE